MKKSVLKRQMMVVATAALIIPFAACSSKKSEVTMKPAPVPAPPKAAPAPAPVATPAPAPAPVAKKVADSNVPAGYSYAELPYPTGQESSSVLLLSKMGPAKINAGQEISYDVIATNISDMGLRNVVVTEELDANFRATSTKPSGTNAGANKQSFDLGELLPGEAKKITITGSTNQTGNMEFCAIADYEMFVCIDMEVVKPALEITKTGPDEVYLCDPIEYTVTVTNTGSGVAESVKISDPLPAGIVTTDGQSNVAIEVGALEAGASRTYTINAESQRTGSFTNTASASSPGINVSSENVTTRVIQPILSVDKTTTGPKDFINARITSTIAVGNSGSGTARNTVVTDTIPSGLQFVRASDGGTISGSTITWNVGDLAPNANRSLTATFRAVEQGVQVNEATVTAECADSVSDKAQVEIVGIPALLLEVVDEFDPIKNGENTIYQITVTNQGSAPDTNIQIDAVLPAELSGGSTTGPTNGTVSGKNVSFAPLSSLAAGEKATWTLEAIANGTGDVRFAIEMNSDNLTSPVNETEATRLYDLQEVD